MTAEELDRICRLAVIHALCRGEYRVAEEVQAHRRLCSVGVEDCLIAQAFEEGGVEKVLDWMR
jgi:hypothetical protein